MYLSLKSSQKMIRKNDLFVNYLTFFIIGLFGFIPIKFSMSTGQVRVYTEGWRRWLWQFWFVQGILYSLYMNLRLVQSTVFGHYVEFHHLAFHIGMAGFSMVMALWANILFRKNPDINQAIFNNLTSCDFENKTRRLKYTGNEVLILNLPSAGYINTLGCFAGLYIYDNRSLEYLYSILPATLRELNQNCGIFSGLVVYESMIMFYYLSVAYIGVYTQQAFIQNCIDQLDKNLEVLKSESYRITWKKMDKLCNETSAIYLRLRLFNKVYAFIIFSWKIYLITGTITYWFFGIRCLAQDTATILLLMYFFLAFFHTALFILMYDKAFKIPDRLEQLKSLASVRGRELKFQDQIDYIDRRMRATPNLGIRVGQFQYFERVSTPIFVDFVTNQIVSLLIAFP